MAITEINVGILIAHSPSAALAPLEAFARTIVGDVLPELEHATGVQWRFHEEEPMVLADDETRRPSDFLDEASLRMVEGPYDLVVVITDVGVVSRKQRVEAGLASPISRIGVLSTRKLRMTARGHSTRPLDSAAVRMNGSTLALHALGHLLGLAHGEGAMAPFHFEESRTGIEPFSAADRQRLRRRAAGLPEREHRTTGPLSTAAFHVMSALRHPVQVLAPLLRNRAPLLPLSLPSLATAAVVPTFILVFTAEIWDVGLGMSDRVAWVFVVLSILASTWYLLQAQNLFFPHKEKRRITEHMAVVNISILLTMLFAVIGLFVMVGLLMLFIEVFIFPEGLMTTWPTLELPREEIRFRGRLRIAAFISAVGVLTGALAGALESRTLIRHLALFEDEP